MACPSDVKVYGGGYVNRFRVAEVEMKVGHGIACELLDMSKIDR